MAVRAQGEERREEICLVTGNDHRFECEYVTAAWVDGDFDPMHIEIRVRLA